MNINKKFGDFITKGKLSYLAEDNKYEYFRIEGADFKLNGVPSLHFIEGTKAIESEETHIKAENFFGIFQGDYRDKILFDVMYRMDGSSLFGENERWHPYYRVSGAYRLTQDFDLPSIDELKIRVAYGTAGQRPPFEAQYESITSEDGNTTQYTLGNKDLKPSRSTELEFGLNVDFLKRFNFEAIYSSTITEDQFLRVQLPAMTGFQYQWRNAASLESKTIEFALGAKLIQTNDFTWTANVLFDKTSMEITKLDVPPFATGPQGQDANMAFYVEKGKPFGIIYGYEWVTSLSDMENQLGDGETTADYEVNSDGYVVPVGTQGTVLELPIKLDVDGDGTPDKVEIGNSNPDFHASFSTNLTYKNFSAYVLFDWKQGGDVFNRTAQWMVREQRLGVCDQFGKPENEKKTVDYYAAFYDVANFTDYFVESTTYVKLREVSLYYSFNKDIMSNVLGGFIKGAKIGLVGRNLLTFTDYSGYDPEVARGGRDQNGQIFGYDAFGYPNFRTFTGSIEFTF